LSEVIKILASFYEKYLNFGCNTWLPHASGTGVPRYCVFPDVVKEGMNDGVSSFSRRRNLIISSPHSGYIGDDRADPFCIKIGFL